MSPEAKGKSTVFLMCVFLFCFVTAAGAGTRTPVGPELNALSSYVATAVVFACGCGAGCHAALALLYIRYSSRAASSSSSSLFGTVITTSREDEGLLRSFDCRCRHCFGLLGQQVHSSITRAEDCWKRQQWWRPAPIPFERHEDGR